MISRFSNRSRINASLGTGHRRKQASRGVGRSRGRQASRTTTRINAAPGTGISARSRRQQAPQ